MKKVLFVCLGNIVRSPLAEHMFRYLVKEEGLEEKYESSSAGIENYHSGETPDGRMVRTAMKFGLKYSGRARQVRPQDLDTYDLIMAMDQSNYTNLLRLTRDEETRRKIHLLREFDPNGGPDSPVPDPYYGGLEGFEEVFFIIQRACRGLIDALERGKV